MSHRVVEVEEPGNQSSARFDAKISFALYPGGHVETDGNLNCRDTVRNVHILHVSLYLQN